jgi:hypothetical protein
MLNKQRSRRVEE